MRAALLTIFVLVAGVAVWMLADGPAPSPPRDLAEQGAEAAAATASEPELVPPGTARERALAPGASSGTSGPGGAGVGDRPLLVVTGVVRGAPAGAPASAARAAPGLTVSARSRIDGVDHVDRQRSDAEGRFTLRIPDPGQRPYSRSVDAYKDGRYGGVRATVTFEEGASRIDGVELIVREHADLVGRVEDPRGRPVEGVGVQVAGGRDVVRSGVDGSFVVERIVAAWHEGVDYSIASDEWIGLQRPDVKRTDDGGWEPLVVVVARRTTLETRLVDAAGAPLAGERVFAGVSWDAGLGHSATGIETAADGTVRHEDVPAGVRVSVGVMERSFGHVAERGAALELVDAAAPGARPLVLDPSGETRVVLRLGPRVTLRGCVLEADGSASPDAQVTIVALDAGDVTRGTHSVRADEAGEFEHSLILAEPAQRLVVAARSRAGEEPALSPFGGPKLPEVRHAAHEVLELPAADSFEAQVVLHLAPLLRIEGRVLGPDAAPLRGSTVRLDGLAAPERALLRTAAAREEVSSGNDGGFRLVAVPPGVHDLVATSSELGAVRVGGVASGTDDVELRFEEARVAVVHVEVVSDAPLDHFMLLRSALRPRSGSRSDAPRLSAEVELAEPTGWPEGVSTVRWGMRTEESELGRSEIRMHSVEGATSTLRLAPGLYWLGAWGTFAAGGRSAAVGTGLVRVEPGEHRVRFVLERTGDVQVILDEPVLDEALFVQVALPGGTLVELEPTEGVRVPRVAVGARLPALPCRPLELQLGTPAELDAGRPRARASVTPRAGEVTSVELIGRR